ncbi:uncharacterized protein LY79DRAFT_565722 [Colletotrichum navitas]|uniref:Uncharacterized protein n=1 Tax=Colletotrichum navitas TaxID=681940 RepID=A0AAD8PS20_9PEZI|nr:uncharacterized protein LY79DRAFT_565722 [Colletotrichum navitas]KAK1574639.1 hypothetical protein LY79DRAFT_565722 [Colletotrichum navitas]
MTTPSSTMCRARPSSRISQHCVLALPTSTHDLQYHPSMIVYVRLDLWSLAWTIAGLLLLLLLCLLPVAATDKPTEDPMEKSGYRKSIHRRRRHIHNVPVPTTCSRAAHPTRPSQIVIDLASSSSDSVPVSGREKVMTRLLNADLQGAYTTDRNLHDPSSDNRFIFPAGPSPSPSTA